MEYEQDSLDGELAYEGCKFVAVIFIRCPDNPEWRTLQPCTATCTQNRFAPVAEG